MEQEVLTSQWFGELYLSKKRILITGFEPFGGESINPSQLLLENLQQESSFSADVDFQLLPVSFQKAAEKCLDLIEGNSYDLVIQLGQAGGRKSICLERVALNWMDAQKDEAGFRPEGGLISSGAPSAYLSRLPLAEIANRLCQQGHDVSVSLSAGAFVCNYLYYKVSEYFEKTNARTQVLFVHVPYLPNQVEEKKEGTPSMDFVFMLAAVRALLLELKSL